MTIEIEKQKYKGKKVKSHKCGLTEAGRKYFKRKSKRQWLIESRRANE